MSSNRLHTVLRAIITYMLLFAFLFQVYNKAVYLHTHLLADGTLITHAHPYTKSTTPGPVTNHSHTRNQIILLSMAELLFSFFAILTISPFIICYSLISEKLVLFHLQSGLNSLNNKSPPELCKVF